MLESKKSNTTIIIFLKLFFLVDVKVNVLANLVIFFFLLPLLIITRNTSTASWIFEKRFSKTGELFQKLYCCWVWRKQKRGNSLYFRSFHDVPDPVKPGIMTNQGIIATFIYRENVELCTQLENVKDQDERGLFVQTIGSHLQKLIYGWSQNSNMLVCSVQFRPHLIYSTQPNLVHFDFGYNSYTSFRYCFIIMKTFLGLFEILWHKNVAVWNFWVVIHSQLVQCGFPCSYNFSLII